MDRSKLHGTGVALVTPFKNDFSIDYNALKRIIDHVSNGGVDYLVILGTTGEAPTISAEEKNSITEFVIENNKKNLPIVYGLGGNSTKWVTDQIEIIKDYPLDAILSLSPYYNKPNQDGIIKHFEVIANASPCPIILYNVPARTSSNLEAATSITLSKHNNIIGIKEASGDLNQCMEIRDQTDEDFLLISGDDTLTLPMMSIGGVGAISVIANVQPKEFSEMTHLALEGKFTEAAKMHYKMLKGYEMVGREGNPVSVKTGLEAIGLLKRNMRLPLTEGSQQLLDEFKSYMSY